MVEINAINLKPLSIIEREHAISTGFDVNKNVGVLVQTCNRVELYYGEGEIRKHLATHLFRVVSGLESGFVGETSIQHQVKQAYQKAKQNNKLNKSLHKLFQTALMVGKRVRTETGISKGALSHGQAAANLIISKFSSLYNTNITIIGVNNINETIIKYLSRKGANTFLIGNRTLQKAHQLAEKYNSNAFDFSQLPNILKQTNILISATSAPHIVVNLNKFPLNKPMLIIDLAIPRDIDPHIGLLPNVELYNLEDIEQLTQQNLKNRENLILKAEEIIHEEVEEFLNNTQIGHRISNF